MRESLFSRRAAGVSPLTPNRGGGSCSVEPGRQMACRHLMLQWLCCSAPKVLQHLESGPVLLPARSEAKARSRRPGVNRDARRAAGGSMAADSNRRRCSAAAVSCYFSVVLTRLLLVNIGSYKYLLIHPSEGRLTLGLWLDRLPLRARLDF